MKGNASVVGAFLVLLVTLPSAEASIITYGFEVTATSGPLTGQSATGTFSFDDTIVPGGGGSVSQADLFTDLDFTWNGLVYDENTANTGSLYFSASGDLTIAFFGTSCIATQCGLIVNQENWIALAGEPYGPFDYSISGGGSNFFVGTATLTGPIPVVVPVPEPATLLLFGTGLSLVGLGRSRLRKQRESTGAVLRGD